MLKSTSASPASIKYQFVYNLTPANSLAFEDLTFPSITKHWQKFRQRGPLSGVAVSVNEERVGFVLAELMPDVTRAEVLSFFVKPNYRRQGLGTQLMRYMEIALTKLSCAELFLKYRVTSLTDSALEPILHQQSWQPPETEFVLTKTTAEKLRSAPWVYKYCLPQQFTVFPWTELTKAEKARIVQRKKYPDALSPFTEDGPLEPINSVGLRYQGEVIGWAIAHRIAPDTIRYSSMFVEEPFQKLGRGFALLTEAVRRQLTADIPYFTAAVASNNIGMLRCVDRYFKPYAELMSESRRCVKRLG
ncbi:GNAT family N-acetyltransferase [Phormidium sp. CCY1219]|uniref:GNAT family N-acetyltransferase n=1 Tax=Phormidium sp. CCY1219 TaxID=2886104 RepID=UPI002D1F4777|nr:GNAT family N-acetyltransferase [Phormidium sp. CCY1219]MEB3831895.1 GNAT family N-acetyltransferase [Phormidium sp. CCY1219]